MFPIGVQYWELSRNASGWNKIVSHNETTPQPTNFTGHMCLREGDSNFTINVPSKRVMQVVVPGSTCADWPFYYGVDYYAISISHGDVIVEGADVRSHEARMFALP